jgi:FKBP-type peptidyl-prolyl cis-trans isomerase SlyD
MKIEKNKHVSLIYELRAGSSDGNVIEALEETNPMTFVYGTGRLLPHFEEKLLSLQKGDNFTFGLESAQAYGEKSEDMIINVPISVFETDGKIDENICQVGNEVPMMDNEGNRINCIVNEITDTYIRMDFNHPMAGTNLYFTGKVIDVRDATPEEIEGTNHSCSSCGSHDHESGCNGSCS